MAKGEGMASKSAAIKFGTTVKHVAPGGAPGAGKSVKDAGGDETTKHFVPKPKGGKAPARGAHIMPTTFKAAK